MSGFSFGQGISNLIATSRVLPANLDVSYKGVTNNTTSSGAYIFDNGGFSLKISAPPTITPPFSFDPLNLDNNTVLSPLEFYGSGTFVNPGITLTSLSANPSITASSSDPNQVWSGPALGSLVDTSVGSNSLLIGDTTSALTPSVGVVQAFTQQITNYTDPTIAFEWKGLIVSGREIFNRTNAPAMINIVVKDVTRNQIVYEEIHIGELAHTPGDPAFIPTQIDYQGSALGVINAITVGGVSTSVQNVFTKGGTTTIPDLSAGSTNNADRSIIPPFKPFEYTSGWVGEVLTLPTALQGDTFQLSILAASEAQGSGPAYLYLQEPTVTPPTYAITAQDADKPDGRPGTATNYTFLVSRSGSTASADTLTYSVSDPAGVFQTAGQVQFVAGQANATLTLTAVGAIVIQPVDFRVTLTSSSSGATISTPTAAGRIEPNYVTPAYSITPASADKADGLTGTTPYTFTVSRSGDTTLAGNLTYTVSGAAAGLFPQLTGPVQFLAGQATATVTLLAAGAQVTQPEDFAVTLSGANGEIISTPTANGRVEANVTTLARFSITAVQPSQTDAQPGDKVQYTFSVSRAGNVSAQSTVSYTVAGFGGSPTPASNLSPSTGSVTFRAGETIESFVVTVAGAAIYQDQRFQVTLVNPAANQAFDVPSATAVVGLNTVLPPQPPNGVQYTVIPTNDSQPVGLSGQTRDTFVVNRFGNVTGSTALNYSISFDNLPNQADSILFEQQSGTVSFAPGQTSATVSILVDGAAITAPEQFRVSFQGPGTSIDVIETISQNYGPLGPITGLTGGGSSAGTSTPVGTLPAENDVILVSGSIVGVARFFDTRNGTHFFTGSAVETDGAIRNLSYLKSEGLGFGALDPDAAVTDPNGVAVYRFFDTTFGVHFYTTSSTERDTINTTLRNSLTYEGVGFYEHSTAQSGDTAVYRFFDTTNGTHFYTASATEHASIIASIPTLKDEGVAFYAPKVG